MANRSVLVSQPAGGAGASSSSSSGESSSEEGEDLLEDEEEVQLDPEALAEQGKHLLFGWLAGLKLTNQWRSNVDRIFQRFQHEEVEWADVIDPEYAKPPPPHTHPPTTITPMCIE